MDMTTEKPFACQYNGCGMSFTNEDHLMVHEKKHEMMLNLSLSGQKTGNIFVADQTPTPTRLIKNCEEVGLFDDLRHVNPFDETFRRAVEQRSGLTPSSHMDLTENDRNPEEDSLHTPQVFPQIDGNETFRSCDTTQKEPENLSATMMLDVPVVDQVGIGETPVTEKAPVSRQSSSSSSFWNCGGKLHKYRNIAEKPPSGTVLQNEEPARISNLPQLVQLPASIQLIQPQVITLSFPTSNNNKNINNCTILGGTVKSRTSSGVGANGATVIPVQTVKPFIMPKLTTSLGNAERNVSTSTPTLPTIQPEPSSASLTPTSQLPIKERLKVILSNSSKSRIIELPQKSNVRRTRGVGDVKTLKKCDEDFMIRRRAASTRYRVKMRSVHEDLRHRNSELQGENEKLKQRVRELESALAVQKNSVLQLVNSEGSNQMLINSSTTNLPAQIQIPASTVHLVMNIPKLIIPPSGPPVMRNPITFSVEKK